MWAIPPRHTAQHATASLVPRGILLQCGKTRAAALLLLLGLAACSGAARPDASPAVPASPTSYPDLASVPPRPRLSYTVEQRRKIADQLVADRENARHRAAELAYATGQSAEPPPPRPPAEAGAAEAAAAPAPAPAPAEPPGDAPIARAYVQENLSAAADTGRLRRFMRRLERKIPDPYGPRSIAEAVGLAGRAEPAAAPAPEPAPAGQPATEQEEAPGSHLGGLLGLEGGGTAPARLPAPGSVVARIPAPAAGEALPPDAQSQLARAVEIARATRAKLRVVAPAAPQGRGIDRGRQVAVALMQAGASASQLELGTGAAGGEVLVYLGAPQAI